MKGVLHSNHSTNKRMEIEISQRCLHDVTASYQQRKACLLEKGGSNTEDQSERKKEEVITKIKILKRTEKGSQGKR